jgi:hypothetical protein
LQRSVSPGRIAPVGDLIPRHSPRALFCRIPISFVDKI